MSRSCNHYEEIPWKASTSLVGIEPLLQFAANGFWRLCALFHAVGKSITLAFELLVTEIEYRIGLSLLLGAHGFRRLGVLRHYCKNVTLAFECLIIEITELV
jgi:hypothetical protein